MVTVAVVGPTSHMGQNLIKAILASTHQLVVLSRSARPELVAQGVPVHVVKYDDHALLAQALQGVDVLLSCIWAIDAHVSSHLALLAACKEAGVKRFAPSEWAVPVYDTITPYAPKRTVWEACLGSGLECTRFQCGVWTNILGYGAPHDAAGALSGYDGPPFAVQVDKRRARLALDGSGKVVFTRLQDVAAFVVKALDLPTWDADTYIVGDCVSFKDVVAMAEEVTGETFEVTYSSKEEIEAGINSNDFFTMFLAQFEKAIAGGELEFGVGPNGGKKSLDKVFPEVKAWTVREFLQKHFAK